MIRVLDLVDSVSDPEIRKDIVNYLFGVLPADGKVRDLENIKRHPERYAKLAEKVDRLSPRK
jgi:hypothetical protein